jgi:hypothetical protein
VAAAGGCERVCLVGPERLDARRGEPLPQGRVEVVGNRFGEPRLRALPGGCDEFLLASRFKYCLPGVRRLNTGHG